MAYSGLIGISAPFEIRRIFFRKATMYLSGSGVQVKGLGCRYGTYLQDIFVRFLSAIMRMFSMTGNQREIRIFQHADKDR